MNCSHLDFISEIVPLTDEFMNRHCILFSVETFWQICTKGPNSQQNTLKFTNHQSIYVNAVIRCIWDPGGIADSQTYKLIVVSSWETMSV